MVNKYQIYVKIEWRDIWIGIYPSKKDKMYICLLPCIAIIIDTKPDIFEIFDNKMKG